MTPTDHISPFNNSAPVLGLCTEREREGQRVRERERDDNLPRTFRLEVMYCSDHVVVHFSIFDQLRFSKINDLEHTLSSRFTKDQILS